MNAITTFCERALKLTTVIFVVIFSLLIGAFLLMTGLALTFQTYFEGQVEAAKTLSQ